MEEIEAWRNNFFISGSINCQQDVFRDAKQEATPNSGNQEVFGEDAMLDSGLKVKMDVKMK